MSVPPEVNHYSNNFCTQLGQAIVDLNIHVDPTARFNILLRLQAAFDVLRTAPAGAQPYDPDVVTFVGNARNVLEILYTYEIHRYHFFCDHVEQLRARNNASIQPQPPLPPSQ
jgi:hypothetical protein